MTLDDAIGKVVTGYKVRHDGMAEGNFIEYSFDGFKQNGKPWFWDEADKKADWYVLDTDIKEGNNWDIGAALDDVVEVIAISITKTGKFEAVEKE